MNNGGDLDTTEMDSEGFVISVEEKLILLAPITEFMIKKQLSDLGVTRNTLTFIKTMQGHGIVTMNILMKRDTRLISLLMRR